MSRTTLRCCPTCKAFTLLRDYTTIVELYVCSTCGYAVNGWNLMTGSTFEPPAARVVAKPKPIAFGRTKTRKPTKKQLAALSEAIGPLEKDDV